MRHQDGDLLSVIFLARGYPAAAEKVVGQLGLTDKLGNLASLARLSVNGALCLVSSWLCLMLRTFCERYSSAVNQDLETLIRILPPIPPPSPSILIMEPPRPLPMTPLPLDDASTSARPCMHEDAGKLMLAEELASGPCLGRGSG